MARGCYVRADARGDCYTVWRCPFVDGDYDDDKLLLPTKHTCGTNMCYVWYSSLLDLCRSDVATSLLSPLHGTRCGMCNCAWALLSESFSILDNTHA